MGDAVGAPGVGSARGAATGAATGARRRRRVVVPLLGLALVAGTAACGGGGEEEDYCAAFLERREELSDLSAQQAEAAKTGGTVDVLTPTLTAFEDLRSAAPEDLQDEWDTLVFAYRDLAEAVEDSGVDPAEFRVGEVPEGLALEDRRVLVRVASKLGAPRVVEAANGVEGYSAQVCEETDEGSDDEAEPAEAP